MRNTSIPSLFLLVSSFLVCCGFALQSCAPIESQQFTLACTKTTADVMMSAKEFIESKGFTVEDFQSEAGYLRTAPKKYESVNEIMSSIPKYVIAIVEMKNGMVQVKGRVSTPKITGASPISGGVTTLSHSDEDEVELKPGDRMYRTHIQPIADHVQSMCEKK